MSSESMAARLATSGPDDLAATTQATIAEVQAKLDRVRSGGLESLALLDEYDEAMAGLTDLIDLTGLIAATSPHQPMRDAAELAQQELSKVRTETSLDPELYQALAKIDVSGADPVTLYAVETILRDFRRAGVDRDEPTRARVRELQDELVALGQTFTRIIRTDTRTAQLPAAALAGLPEDYREAHLPDADGNVSINTEYPDVLPFLTYATDAAAREQMWRLFRLRGYPKNTKPLRSLIERRHELAALLGYPSWAQYIAEDKMIGSADNITAFIERIATAAAPRAAADYERLLERKRVDSPDAAEVLPWDQQFLNDRVKAEQLAFDSQTLRPYFEYGRVKEGLMRLVERLFAIRFRARPDIPVWHEEVECHDVTSVDGELLGRIFLDMHPRADKYSHAAMFQMTTGKTGRRVPECALVCNLPRPGASPALLLHSEVVTFFHEFGHLVHHICAVGPWAIRSGLTVEWDFVEAPSQLLEEWVRDAETLAGFAVHHETGEPIPAELVARLRVADEFGKGMSVRQQMAYAWLSLELFRRDPEGLDPVAVERESQERFTRFPYVDGTYLHLSFGHLDGYSALYSTYMWSLVIAKDLFTVFARDGLLSAQTAARYRDAVLAPGGGAPAAELVANFLGRPYNFDAFQAWLDAD